MKGTKKSKRLSKGVSPLVASVLLIAVTMTIAGLLAYWASSFVRTSLPEINQTDANCRVADFNIYSCTYSSSTGTLTLILENMRNIEIYNLRLFMFFPNGTVSDPRDLSANLPPSGMLKSYTVSDINDVFSKISIACQCPDIKKEKTCASI